MPIDDLLLAAGLIPRVDVIIDNQLSRCKLEQNAAGFAGRIDCKHI